MSGPSVGIVHDYLLVLRGAERTFAAIADCFPDAPIYTLLYDEAGTDGVFAGRDIHTSYLQRLGARQRGFRRLLPLFPRAAERLVDRDHDLILSSSSAFAHGVRLPPSTLHVCYCHSPLRYAWFEQARALEETRRVMRPLLKRTLRRLQAWDRAAARRVARYIANSELTRERIWRYWKRESTVVYPPVDLDRFSLGTPEDFLLIVSELVPHKRIDVALEAANRAGRPIKIVGTGPDARRLQRAYAGSAEFLGRIADDELAALYARALAVVVPSVEEFGIVAVEAQASGRPVVGNAAGGTYETVIDGETGVLVPIGDVEALTDALRRTDFEAFVPEQIRAHACQFSRTTFRERIREELLAAGAPVDPVGAQPS